MAPGAAVAAAVALAMEGWMNGDVSLDVRFFWQIFLLKMENPPFMDDVPILKPPFEFFLEHPLFMEHLWMIFLLNSV